MSTSNHRPDWRALNAYVDGTLSPEEARALENSAACDPEVARAIDDLRRAKDATAVLLNEMAKDAPPLPSRAAPALRRDAIVRRTANSLWAAAAAIILLVAGLAFWPTAPGPDRLNAWIDEAEQQYRQRLDDPLLAAPEPATLPASLTTQAAAFDLSLAGINLVETSASEQGVYLAYQGHRGCRLGLWVGTAPERMAPALEESLHDGLLLATWRSGETGYALLSQDMDPRRFSVISRLLMTRTTEMQQIAADVETLTLPCLG